MSSDERRESNQRCRSALLAVASFAHRPFYSPRGRSVAVLRIVNTSAWANPLKIMVSVSSHCCRNFRSLTFLLPHTGKTVHKFPLVSLRTDLPEPPHKIKGKKVCETEPECSVSDSHPMSPRPQWGDTGQTPFFVARSSWFPAS